MASVWTAGDVPAPFKRAGESGALLGLVPDLAWVGSTVLTAAAQDLGVRDEVRLERRTADVTPRAARAPVSAALPGYEVVTRPTARPSLARDIGPFAATTLLVVAVLAIGVVLLVRDVARETDSSPTDLFPA